MRTALGRIVRWAPGLLCLVVVGFATGAAADPIDRRALVTRHNPRLTHADPWAPLTVGNGHFAFTVDITGLQTFGETYRAEGIPLETLARWAWHTDPNPRGYRLEDANVPYTAHGRTVDYPTDMASDAAQWLRRNPHDLPLGILGIDLLTEGGGALRAGAAVDFSGSHDPRAAELERRVVLSQYVTAVQMAGDVPPQETGLTCSSWYGKHHTEMAWWHMAHFALWGREAFVEGALRWYQRRLPVARGIAESRGLKGARWPKMVGPEGRESPGGNPLIVWNQPHPIALAELLYRAKPSSERLGRYRDLVLETAEGLASMLHWVETEQRYVLGPPLWISQEIYDPRAAMNPSFELSYWGHALGVAQTWRERLGMDRSPEWDHALEHLSELPRKDGRYAAVAMMAGGWDGASPGPAPGFPDDGSWTVAAEGLLPLP